MTFMSARMSLIIALLFHVTKIMSVITPLMIVIIALTSFIIQVVSVMTAVMIDTTGVTSVIIRIMWHIIGITWLTRKVRSGPIETITDPNRGAKNPTLAPG